MKKTIEHKLDVAAHIIDICRQLQTAGYETYVVGGAVRDFLIDRIPKDYDISTAATPEDIRRVFGRRHARIIGRRFRLVHLHCAGEIIEISTFRRKPSREDQDVKIRNKLGDVPDNMIFNDNEFGSAREDAERRDFTINAVFYDPVARMLVDYTGMGLDDIADRVVRAIGNPEQRFQEDPVRVLRALKFAGQCDMTLAAETEAALVKSVPLIQLAAPSRLTLELEKILKNASSHKIFRIFHHYGFLTHFLPRLNASWHEPEGMLAMQLLEIRNRRLAEGCYRDSISVAMSMLVLPYLEQRYGKAVDDESWFDARSREEFSDDIFAVMREFFAPHTPIKALCFSAERTLRLLPELFRADKLHRALQHPGYPHAREMVAALNELRWHYRDLEERFPVPSPQTVASGRHAAKSGRRRRRPRYQNKAPKTTATTGTPGQ
ncbi:MAG: hypothetical protein PHQ27_06470 [Victivallales bacterium]|nr:hypothetical protein [Victivallales bacterium]